MVALLWFFVMTAIAIFDVMRRPRITLDFLRFFNVFFVIYYPLQGILFSIDASYWSGGRYVLDFGSYQLAPLFISIAFYLSVLTGYYYSRKLSFSVALVPKSADIPVRKIIGITLPLFIIILIAYTSLYGGLSEAISLAKSLRAGFAERNDYAFLKRFFWLAPLSMILIGSRILLYRKERGDSILLIVAAGFSFISAILLSSRGAMVLPVAILAIAYTYGRGRVLSVRFNLSLVGIFAFILIGDNAWDYFAEYASGQTSSENLFLPRSSLIGVLDGLVRNFQSNFVSAQAWHENYSISEEGLRWGIDIPLAIASLAPEKVLGLSIPPTIAAFNTSMVLGFDQSIVPPGLAVFSLYTVGVPGLFLIPFLYGVAGRLVHKFCLAHWGIWWVKAGYAAVGFNLARIQSSGEPKVILLGFMGEIFVLFILFFLGYLSFRRRHRRHPQFA